MQMIRNCHSPAESLMHCTQKCVHGPTQTCHEIATCSCCQLSYNMRAFEEPSLTGDFFSMIFFKANIKRMKKNPTNYFSPFPEP